jgi:hypothetical protein
MLVLSCAFNSLMVQLKLTAAIPPYPIGVTVNEPKPNPPEAALREDMMLPELHYMDKQQRNPTGFATEVTNSTKGGRSEFPQSW